MTYDPIAMRRADLQRQIADAQRQLDTMQMVPSEDSYPNGAMIRAEIRVGTADPATYLFLKIVRPLGDASLADPTRWYHTGFIAHSSNPQHGRRQNDPFFYSWRELQTWLIERGRVVESWELLEVRCELDHTTNVEDFPWSEGAKLPVIIGYGYDHDKSAILRTATYRSGHWEMLVRFRSHEDVQSDILDVLRFEYGDTAGYESKHARVINKIMGIEGVYK